MERLLNIKYSGLNGTYWMFYAVITSFSSAFLLARGYSNGEIGVILAAGNVAAVFLQPVMADFADRSKKISLLGFLQLSTILLMVLTFFLFVLGEKSAALWVVYVMNVAWFISIQPLFNSLAFKLEETGAHINFGVCRSVGSLCYAILCAFLGTLVEAAGVQILPVTGEIILVALMITLIITKTQFNRMVGEKTAGTCEIAAKAAGSMSGPSGQEEEEINLLRFIKRNKLFVVINVACLGIFFGNSILNNFMLQVVEGVGGSSEDMGRIFSVMAFLEIPALALFDRIRKRFSCQFLLKVGAISFFIKILLIYLADSVTMLYVAHLFQTTSFGIFLPAMVLFINEIMAKGEAVKGQALYTVMTTVSSVAASICGGFVLDYSGPKFLLLLSSVFTIIGAAAVLIFIDRIKRRE
ncbi:MAG: MFS transporter [Firmicutes bacterium]|nr:MFS transporter [Bacillota bacterium]